MDHNEILQQLDGLIKANRLKQAQVLLRKTLAEPADRAYKYKYSDVARRVGLVDLSLRLLSPIVRPKKPIHPEASPDEVMSYGASLIKVGNFLEGEELLNQVNPKDYPQSLFFVALGMLTQWRYKEAAPLFRKYLKSNTLSDYQIAVAKYNLASTLIITEQFDKAQKTADEVIALSQKNNWNLLVANAYRVHAQCAFDRADYSDSNQYLFEALKWFENKDSLFNFFARKLFAFNDLYRTKNSEKAQRSFLEVLDEAKKRGHAETLRECDLFSADINNDKDKMNHLYFGTPYNAYRQRILKRLGESFTPEASYIYRTNHANDDCKIISLECPNDSSLIEPIKLGGVMHSALKILLEDFYKPIPKGLVFSKLYEGEYYNPDSSPHRVHDVMCRLNEWFKSNEMDLNIKLNGGSYKLTHSDEKIGIKIDLKQKIKTGQQIQVDKLYQLFEENSFSSKKASEALGVSKPTAIKILNWAVENQQAATSGNGRGKRYYIKKAA